MTSILLIFVALTRSCITRQFAESGTDVVVHYHGDATAGDAEDTAKAVRTAGRRALLVQGDPPATAVVGTSHIAFVTGTPGVSADGAARIITLNPPTHVPLIALWLQHRSSDARDAFLRTIQHRLDALAAGKG